MVPALNLPFLCFKPVQILLSGTELDLSICALSRICMTSLHGAQPAQAGMPYVGLLPCYLSAETRK